MHIASRKTTTMDKSLSLPTFEGFGGAVNDKGQLGKARLFVASKFGVSKEDIKGKNFKALKELLVAKGVDKDQIKAAQKEFDGHRVNYYRQVNQINAVLAADPRFRKTIKIWKSDKTGKVSANVSYREESKLSTSAQQRADNAEAKIRELEARIAKLTALTA